MSKQGTTSEKLSALCTDVSWLKQQMSNHLHAHWNVTCILLSAIAIQTAVLVFGVIKTLLASK
jgi:hypothetical protein